MRELAWTLFAFFELAALSPAIGRLDSQFFAPDVALLAALYAGSRTTLLRAVAVGFTIGLLKDGLSLAVPVGLHTEICVLAVLAARLLERRVDLRSPVPLMATVASLSVVATGVFLMLEAIFHRDFEAYGDVTNMALPLALVTMLVAPVQFALFDWLSRRFEVHGRSTLLQREP